jgi:tRNA(fMet)-specific endonuclease VapC
MIVDTSAYSAFARGQQGLRKWFSGSQQLQMPLPVLAELYAGFAFGTQAKQNHALLERFLGEPHVTILTMTNKTALLYAQIYTALRRAGRPIGVNDMWIAALAMEHGVPLLTLDADFKHVVGLELVKL